MLKLTRPLIYLLGPALVLLLGRAPANAQHAMANCRGVVSDASGNALPGAMVELRGGVAAGPEGPAEQPALNMTVRTDANGVFAFQSVPPGTYRVLVRWKGSSATAAQALTLHDGEGANLALELGASDGDLTLRWSRAGGSNERQEAKSSGKERLSSRQVSDLPLNKRDFTHLLQLAAGTTTDTNGAANFTQQFAINGQRGTTAVFAMDGIDTTDPELGGATFANFNVDAIQEIDSESGVLPATRGEGAAGFTNVVTKSGTDQVHGSVFEFVRNAAFDARNFFDRRSEVAPGRIPPFLRNEFGITVGGPVVWPGSSHGHHRTFFFGQYQGFRQVLGTTQVLAVPTLAERAGVDTTTYSGDTLHVPVNPAVVAVLNGYPKPNDAQGTYGARTYATSSKVATSSDQFSIRIDHRISDQAQFSARFNLDDTNGPPTNPSQTAINPGFVLRFFDHQRNLGLTYTRTPRPNLVWESALGFIRSTPLFTTVNRTQPGLTFADALYESFNGASGANFGAWGNLWQVRQSISWAHGSHSIKAGFEARFNRDTTIFAMGPNGTYTFGGGTAYSPVEIPSASGTHDIHPGDPLPDSLTQFLTGTPFAFTASVAGPQFPQGNVVGLAAVHREAYNAFFQDAWKVTPRLMLTYGVRYEVNARIHEGHHLTSAPRIVGPDGAPARSWDPGARQEVLIDPQPPYRMDWRGWGPRLSADWRATDHTTLRAGAALTTLLPNLWIDNGLTGGIPYVLNPYLTASAGVNLPFTGSIVPFSPPPPETLQGQPVFAASRTTDVPANTELDLQRLEDGLAALSPGHETQALLLFGMASHFQNGYAGTYTAGFEHSFGDLSVNASYVGSVGVKLVGFIFPNNYGGADPAFAPFTRFDAAGRVLGGIGPEFMIGNPSHSTFHSFETGISKTSARFGLGFQANYTLSKSLDNSSTPAVGMGNGGSSTVLQPAPQDPRNPGTEKGPSTFDVRHILAFNFVQVLPFDRVGFLRPVGSRLTSGWQLLNISVFTSGSPFSVLSGVQQTGLGSGGADRPDQVGRPVFSTHRTVREDYFGLGADNPSFFSIPLDVPDGTGPNHGRFGTLGRDTFRGPGFKNFDVALMKDTPLLGRGRSEPVTLQFRAELFNVFNLVNFGLPNNIVKGTGFGLISRTAGTSRQLQFSLKLVY